MGLIFLRNRVSGVAPFSPLSLFASGEEGAWYEPSTSTCLTDLEGFTFATYGQPVAHLIDKSQGATIEARRNLLKRTEEFDNAVWDVGGFTKTSYTETDPDGGNTALLITENDTSVSPYFRYNADVSDGTSQTFSVWIKATSEVSGVNLSTTGSVSNSTITITTSWQRFDVTASTNHSTGPYIGGFLTITRGSGVGIYVWHPQLETGSSTSAYQKITDGQTVSWLPGNHATQTTLASRPILARVPEGGRRNELVSTATLATQSVTVTAAERTLSFKGTGTVTLTGASTAGPLVGTGVSDRVTLTFTPSAGSLTLTVSGTVTDAQLELGATATAYQLVADADGYDITEGGVDSLDYLSFDGTDDVMVARFADTTYFNSSVLGIEVPSGANDFIIFGPETITEGYILVGVDGSALTTLSGRAGSPSFRLDATAWTPTNRAQVYSDLATGSPHALTIENVVFSDASWANLLFLGYKTSVDYTGKVFGGLILDRAFTTEERANTETYFANRSGVTL